MTDHDEQIERICEHIKGKNLEEIDVYRHKDGPVLIFRFLSDTEAFEFQVPPVPPEIAIRLGRSLLDVGLEMSGESRQT